MQKEELQQHAIALIEQLSTEELEVVVEMLNELRTSHVPDTPHSVEAEARIALKKIMKNYERAWKTLAKM